MGPFQTSTRVLGIALVWGALVVGAGCRSLPSLGRSGDRLGAGALTLSAEDERQIEAFARYAAGVVEEESEAPDRALDQYLAAVAQDPDNEVLVLEVCRKLIERRRLEDARLVLVRASRREGASGKVWGWLGTVCSLQGNPAAATESLREAIRRDPADPTFYRSLAVLHLEAGRKAEALAILDEAATQSGTDSDFLLALADSYLALQMARDAEVGDLRPRVLAVLDRALALNPTRPDVVLRLADRLAAVGEEAKALTLYQGLIEREPEMPGLHERLAVFYARTNDREKAVEQLRMLAKARPTNWMPHYLLGLMALEARQFEDAIASFNRLLVLRPDQEGIYYEVAVLHLSHQRPADALEVLNRARVRFRPGFRMEYLTAVALSGLERYAESIRPFTAAEVMAGAFDQGPLTATFYFQFGVAHERLRQFEEAAVKFEKALDLQPDFADALNYLGYMWAEQGTHLERALGMIQKAVALEPDNEAYLDSLAWVLRQLGRSAEALPHQLRAVDLASEPDPVLYDHLGDIYRDLGRMEEARGAWRRALDEKGASPEIQKKLEESGQ